MNDVDDAESNRARASIVNPSGALIAIRQVMSKTFRWLLPDLVTWECTVAFPEASVGEQQEFVCSCSSGSGSRCSCV